MPEIVPLTQRQNSRDTLLQYADGVLLPALAATRLLYAELHGRALRWQQALSALVPPPQVDKKAMPGKPSNRNLINPSVSARHSQLESNLNAIKRQVERFDGAGDSNEASSLWKRFGQAVAKFEACDAEVQQAHSRYASELAVWEQAQERLLPEQAYRRQLDLLRSEGVALVAIFNRKVEFDDPIPGREAYLNQYSSFVPTHHFYRRNVAKGTYFYVFEHNQIDVHLHCGATHDGDVDLITFKKWGANEPYTARRPDTYLGQKRGLTRHSPHLQAGLEDNRFTGLLAHLRTNYPPVNSAEPQRIDPPLPRARLG